VTKTIITYNQRPARWSGDERQPVVTVSLDPKTLRETSPTRGDPTPAPGPTPTAPEATPASHDSVERDSTESGRPGS